MNKMKYYKLVIEKAQPHEPCAIEIKVRGKPRFSTDDSGKPSLLQIPNKTS